MNDQEWLLLRSKARDIADEEYAVEASNIIKLTKKEIASIIESAEVDKEKFSELIVIINDVSKTNTQKAEAIKKISGLAEVAVSLIKKLV